MPRVAPLFILMLLVACSAPSNPTEGDNLDASFVEDAGLIDAGDTDGIDGGVMDAGVTAQDAGSPDAQSLPDAGTGCGLDIAGAYGPAKSANGTSMQQKQEAQALTAQLAQLLARLRTDTGNVSSECLTNLDHLMSRTGPCACGSPRDCEQAFPGDPCWDGPYATLIPVDPWGTPYKVSVSAEFRVEVRSFGPDGLRGTNDDIWSTL